MDSSYAEPGTCVILLSRFPNPADWGTWVGRKARIIRPMQLSPSKCIVIVDDQEMSWKIQNMILASDVPLLTPEQKRYLRIQDG
jgi:hypothetical protein